MVQNDISYNSEQKGVLKFLYPIYNSPLLLLFFFIWIIYDMRLPNFLNSRNQHFQIILESRKHWNCTFHCFIQKLVRYRSILK